MAHPGRGDILDADYGAPTSLGPPYQVYELVPTCASGFPAQDGVEPTRWSFDRTSDGSTTAHSA